MRELKDRNIAACAALDRERKNVPSVDALKYPARVRMAELLQTPEGRAHYRRRKGDSRAGVRRNHRYSDFAKPACAAWNESEENRI